MAEAPFELSGLDHLVLRVRDMQSMIAFYCEVLGCGLEREVEEVGLVQLRAGASLIDLVDSEGKIGRAGGAAPGPAGRNVDHFCLRIDGFDEGSLTAYLTAAGVRLGEGGMRYGADGTGPSLYIYDPEDNVVELKGAPVRPGP
ncbi:MAG TPA: VOC family virulence protein [Rhodospirillaceae bacterium]|nr:VOC family virulence protein [Rhodospirillaceae bacterium]HAA92450.1 VOC family virulence protein [Rhodospirillaceae bacterium]HAT35970.1 VOC family virulence protein [Rhodospirillaceae bacterium]